MRVLVVAPQPFYQERGTPMAVRLVVETLCAQGHEVDLLAYHEGEDIAVAGLRIFRARRPWGVRHVPIGISLAKLQCDVALCVELGRLLKSNRYDVVHAVEESVFPAALLKARYGYKLVYDMDSSLVDQLVDKWRFMRPLRRLLAGIERFAVRRADRALAVCEDLGQKIRPWIGAERVTVLPDVPMGEEPPDVEAYGTSKQLRAHGSLTAMYVGNLENYQGIDLMLEGFAACGVAGLALVVIGGLAEHIARYRERAQRLGVGERVQFLGPRPVAKLRTYLAEADILLSPRTLGGNTPMKVYSYMQAGKAILATDIRSHTQVLDPECAVLARPDPRSFAAALSALANDPLLRARLGHAAHEKVEREFSLPVFRQRLKLAYEHLDGVLDRSRAAKPWLCRMSFHVWRFDTSCGTAARARCFRCGKLGAAPLDS
jgi:glycosyltransferase involved in cell wall biosynthesis